MDKYQKKRKEATLSSKEPKVKPKNYFKQGNQLSIPFEAPEILHEESKLMEAICDHENLNKAYKNVLKNKGGPGIDRMTIEELLPYLKAQGQEMKEQLLDGTFKFEGLKQVEIPKIGSKRTRKLGIATVKDRFVCQAILQVMQKFFDGKFSDHSYGFRPGKSAHQAISQAQKYIAAGYEIVVDIDLENFFDKINHNKLMSEIGKTVKDKILLKLVRRLVTTGIISKGVMQSSDEGTPQGNPLSPLLSNIMLDLLDKELEKRGHKFCRFADDCNVYVRSERSGERVMQSLKTFIEKKLKLKVNQNKSAVDRVYKRTFLGFSFFNFKKLKIRLSPKTIKVFKDKIRQLTRRGKWMRMSDVIEKVVKYVRGWLSYFGYSQTSSELWNLESWLRRRLRCAFWQQWKTGKNRFKQLRKLGVKYDLASQTAGSKKGSWRVSLSPALSYAFPNAYFHKQGIPKFTCRAC